MALWYVDSSVASSGNGTSWATAWKGVTNITGVAAGDTVYFSGGPTSSSQIYLVPAGGWTPIGGAPGNPVTYSVGQDSQHNGMAWFKGNGTQQFLVVNPPSNIVFTGYYGTAYDPLSNLPAPGIGAGSTQHMAFGNSVRGGTLGAPVWDSHFDACFYCNSAGQSNNLTLSYCYFPAHTRVVTLTSSLSQTGLVVDHCWMSKVFSGTTGINDDTFYLIGLGGSAALGGSGCNIHHNFIASPCSDTIGFADFGDDIFRGGSAFDVHDNRIQAYRTPYPTAPLNSASPAQHADAFQNSVSFARIYNNWFENIGESILFHNPSGGSVAATFTDIVFCNNVVTQSFFGPGDASAARGLSLVEQDNVGDNYVRLIITNNMFCVPQLFTIKLGDTTGAAASTTWSQSRVQNNIFFNCANDPGNSAASESGLWAPNAVTNVTVSNNYRAVITDFANLSGFTWDAINTRLIGPLNWLDFQPVGTSPVIDAGSNAPGSIYPSDPATTAILSTDMAGVTRGAVGGSQGGVSITPNMYVNTATGSDVAPGDGSQAHPWKTITKAASVAVAGTMCSVAAGTYNEAVTISKVGTQAQPIIFQGVGLVTVNIQGDNQSLNLSGQWITFDNFTVIQSAPGGTNFQALIRLSGSHCTLSRVTCNNWPIAATTQSEVILFDFGSADCTCDHCLIYNIINQDGWHIYGTRNTISNCEVYGLNCPAYDSNHADVFQWWGNSGNQPCTFIQIVNNYFHDCLQATHIGVSQVNISGADDGKVHDCVIANNVFQNIDNGYFLESPNVRVYNNIFTGLGVTNLAALYFYQTANNQTSNCPNLNVRNNVFINNHQDMSSGGTYSYPSTPSGQVIDNNYFATNFTGTGEASIPAKYGTNPKNGGPPAFVNPTGSPPDFHIGSASVLKGTGVDCSSDLNASGMTLALRDKDGNLRTPGAWDMGPYGFNLGAWSIGPFENAAVAPASVRPHLIAAAASTASVTARALGNSRPGLIASSGGFSVIHGNIYQRAGSGSSAGILVRLLLPGVLQPFLRASSGSGSIFNGRQIGTNRPYAGTPSVSGSSGSITVRAQTPSIAFPLKISPNGRYLVDQINRPVFLVGDSGWDLIANASPADRLMYLQTRASQGFNCIMFAPFADKYLFGNASGNCQSFEGLIPFIPTPTLTAATLTSRVEAYWQLVDTVVSQAASLNLAVLLNVAETAPASGGGWNTIWNNTSVADAQNYGSFLGNRYKNYANVLWGFGNDYQNWPAIDTVLTAFAGAIRAAAPGQLMTWELDYQLSLGSNDANLSPYLDLNFAYTYFPTYQEILRGYQVSPVRPLILGEATYEQETYGTGTNAGTVQVMRLTSSWMATAGACGYIYGSTYYKFQTGWQSNLNLPGITQLINLINLLKTQAWWLLVPDIPSNRQLITAGFGTAFTSPVDQTVGGQIPTGAAGTIPPDNYCTGALASDGSFGLCALPQGGVITCNLAGFSGPVTAQWYDASNNTFIPIGSGFTGSQNFTAPAGGNSAGNPDWMLVLTLTTVPTIRPGGAMQTLSSMGANLKRVLRALVGWQQIN